MVINDHQLAARAIEEYYALSFFPEQKSRLPNNADNKDSNSKSVTRDIFQPILDFEMPPKVPASGTAIEKSIWSRMGPFAGLLVKKLGNCLSQYCSYNNNL